jgi:hypothetical protein
MSETPKRSLLHILFDIRGERVPSLPAASSAPRPPMRRGIYILPSLFTLGNMGLGFFRDDANGPKSLQRRRHRHP